MKTRATKNELGFAWRIFRFFGTAVDNALRETQRLFNEVAKTSHVVAPSRFQPAQSLARQSMTHKKTKQSCFKPVGMYVFEVPDHLFWKLVGQPSTSHSRAVGRLMLQCPILRRPTYTPAVPIHRTFYTYGNNTFTSSKIIQAFPFLHLRSFLCFVHVL
jgi:hypothetical protein